MKIYEDQITINGKSTTVRSTKAGGKVIVVQGKRLRVANVKDDVCDSGVSDPDVIIKVLRDTKLADIFSFDQKLPDTDPRFDYYFEWDNHAVLEIESFDYWWNKQIGNDARRMVRKAKKFGVATDVVPFTDHLVNGIKEIYDETPIRRGKPFWHYKKTFADVNADNASFLDRSDFVAAYLGEELIGFDKLIYTDCWAAQIQLIAKLAHRNMCATNALIAKAVETCAEKGIRYLTYGAYVYGQKGEDALTDFKKRNGFRRVDYPRYYVPLTQKGRIALRLGMHRSLIEALPATVVERLLEVRNKYYQVVKSR